MQRQMLKSKIHRATVTGSDLHYVGSVTIDAALMEQADLLPGEHVHVLDVDNGARFETYVIEGERGRHHAPRVVQVDERNAIIAVDHDPSALPFAVSR